MTIPIELTDAELTRYWAKVDVRGLDDYWKWQGYRWARGYGCFWLRGHNLRAHRIACYLEHGDAGKMTCHTCHNPPCCNPAHLYPGDSFSNAHDAKMSSREARGELQHKAILTEKDVLWIMQEHAKGRRWKELAEELGCNKETVRNVYRGRTWSWLTKIEKKAIGSA